MKTESTTLTLGKASIHINNAWKLERLYAKIAAKSGAASKAILEAALAKLPPRPENLQFFPITSKAEWRNGIPILPGRLVKFWLGDPELYDPAKPYAIGRFISPIMLPNGELDALVGYDGQEIQAYKAELAIDPLCVEFQQRKAVIIGKLLTLAEAHPEAIWTLPTQSCRFFTTEKGCRRGSDCKFEHN